MGEGQLSGGAADTVNFGRSLLLLVILTLIGGFVDLLAGGWVVVCGGVLVGFGTAVYSLRSQDALRVTLAVLLTYGIGVVAANLWNITAMKPLYVSLFGILVVGSNFFVWKIRD